MTQVAEAREGEQTPLECQSLSPSILEPALSPALHENDDLGGCSSPRADPKPICVAAYQTLDGLQRGKVCSCLLGSIGLKSHLVASFHLTPVPHTLNASVCVLSVWMRIGEIDLVHAALRCHLLSAILSSTSEPAGGNGWCSGALGEGLPAYADP